MTQYMWKDDNGSSTNFQWTGICIDQKLGWVCRVRGSLEGLDCNNRSRMTDLWKD